MKEYLDYFELKCARSKAVTDEAKKFIPGGVQHNLAFNHPFPIAINRADGAYLWDVDGNQYIEPAVDERTKSEEGDRRDDHAGEGHDHGFPEVTRADRDGRHWRDSLLIGRGHRQVVGRIGGEWPGDGVAVASAGDSATGRNPSRPRTVTATPRTRAVEVTMNRNGGTSVIVAGWYGACRRAHPDPMVRGVWSGPMWSGAPAVGRWSLAAR